MADINRFVGQVFFAANGEQVTSEVVNVKGLSIAVWRGVPVLLELPPNGYAPRMLCTLQEANEAAKMLDIPE